MLTRPGGPVLARQATVDGGPAFPVLSANKELFKRHIQRYGWIPDLPDPRDHLYAAPTMLAQPSRYDLRERYRLPQVYDQGRLGSCSANAIAAAIQFERLRQKLPNEGWVPSRLFIYYNERAIEGTVGTDAGAQIRDGIKSVASQGDCFETGPDSWPYEAQKYNVRPSSACYGAALKDRVVSYSRITPRLDQMRTCLATGYPFVFGLSVYASFEGPEVAQTGVVNLPTVDERPIGGHAVLAVGYDDGSQRFMVRNSWGAEWGQGGYFSIPYAYVTNPGLAGDFWTVRLIGTSNVH